MYCTKPLASSKTERESRVQRKSALQLFFWTSCSQFALAQKLFQKFFLMNRIDYGFFVILIPQETSISSWAS